MLITIVLAFCGCTSDHEEVAEAPKPRTVDTLYIEARAQALYEQEPERALAMIESAEIAGSLPDFRANLLRAKLFSMSVYDQRQDVAQQICESLLRHDSVKNSPTYKREVLELLVNASRMRHDDEQWLRWAMQLSELLQQQDDVPEALRTEAEIGLVMTHLGQVDDGMKKIDDAISQLDGQRRFSPMLAFVLASKRKITVLRETGRYAEIIPVAQRILECLEDYKAHPDDYADGTRREPKSEEERADYYDFYSAQATAFLASAYAELDNKAEARRELAIFEKSNYGHSLDGRKMIAPTLGRLGDYATMLAICNEAEAELRGDTLRYDYLEILQARAEAAEAQGRLAASLDYRKRYEQLNQTLNDRLHRNQTHDYAARYHLQEQQMEIERQQAELLRMNIYITASIVIILLMVAFAVYFVRQKNIVDHKNHVLVEQITDAIDYKKRYEELTKVQAKAQETEQVTNTDDTPDLNSLSDEQLFLYLSDVIHREQLYLNPVCDRQTITDRFGISEKRVGAAFSKGSSYKSLPSFIRDCRLEYACQLLRQNPEMTIGAVAAASGFSNHTRFTADFKTRYSVSPTDFRSLSM